MKKKDNKKIANADKKPSYHHGDLKAALLESAEVELSVKGIETFSLRGVAKRTGVSHAAPAHHFGDTGGLLTALATEGFKRLVKIQKSRQQLTKDDPSAQLASLGLGYIDFAIKNAALFRLMFSSEKPNSLDEVFAATSDTAFDMLVDNIKNIKREIKPDEQAIMTDVMSTWAIIHGLADLLIGGRSNLKIFLNNMNKSDRERTLSNMILRGSLVVVR